ncbi:ABC transporter substrate-binding protein [Paenibacillus chitinolyticus]|uniref:ABC transporter substrate-binding protein n=1 Tax=Paenibacillus chitinolyticus TaxID=79263 RepID=A0A410WZ58_9BACL|nr:ABC transporter substrate-binding protein [Paenibacillus chitinolyticus]MCY9590285.1 ABC transporter substrate-binding protein [Paenibacillus chitinolyticus]MCY9596981.1 ABC transporter substrate-binding protein [Paenibacillus chitinolyticus]QAV19718.1 ABC transporter substrate-binding protein [Paenibacillus chitinolyticus]
MVKFRKWGSVLIAAGLVTLTACGGASGDTSKGSTSSSGAEAAFSKGKYDPPIEISSVLMPKKYVQGDTKENNVHDRWMLETLGIKHKDTWYPANDDQYKQKLQLAIASGEKLPDFVSVPTNPVLTNQLIDSGQFMPIDELFDKYANKILKDHSAAHPELWYPFTRDGKKYNMPILEYTDNDDTLLWLREDWMEKLNLQAPKTIADLENIMDKFKNQNPDGLAPKDIFPLAISLKNNTNTWMGSLDWLFGAYGTIQEQWNKDAAGSLEYGSTNPGAKEALAKLKEWMDKGYIHTDSALWDEAKSAESWTKGAAGILPGANWVPDWPAPDLLKNVKGAKYKAYPIPAGPNGLIGTKWQNSGVNASIMINKDAKHPEAIFLYYNYLLDNLANPAAGSKYEYGFAKGYDWDLIDGKPTSDKEKIKNFSNEFPFLTGPARIPDLYMKTLVKLADGKAPETPYEKQMAEFRKPENWAAAKIVMSQKDIRKQNYFTGAATPTMVSKWNLLRQSELETFNKIIYGKLPITAFDEFVANWKANGGEQITKEVNDWYKSVSSK